MATKYNSTVVDYIYNDDKPPEKKRSEFYKDISDDLLIRSLKVIALLISVSGLFAMMFEVRHFSQASFSVYITRLSATLISFSILVFLQFAKRKFNPVLLVHILLISIIVSSGYMIYLLPNTLVVNSNIVGLMIFTTALFLSWEIKNQIIVSIYYNIVFAAAILLNKGEIYSLPNMFESVLFVLFLSIVSVIGSSINFKLRSEVAEQSLKVRLSQKKYEAIFNNSADGIFQTTPNGHFLTANASLANILGYGSVDELKTLNIPVDIYLNPADRELLCERVKKYGEVKDYRVILKRKDGSNIVARLTDRYVRAENESRYFFEGSVVDITREVVAEQKRKKAEEELKAEKIKSDMLAEKATEANLIKTKFLTNMSHEIRTPMNGVIGFLSLIENDSYRDKEELKQFVSNAKDSAESLLEIINLILDFSKIEAGKITLQEAGFNLLDVLDESFAVVAPRVKEKDLSISREIDTNTNLDLIGDATRLRQVLVNILSNAVKFTDDGEIKIRINSEKCEDNYTRLIFAVEDTGIGIPADKINDLFKPFSQVDGSHTRKYGGTGLGLVISKEFVSMMGGEIGVKSIEGVGSTFTFSCKFKIDTAPDNLKSSGELNKLYVNNEPEEITIDGDESFKIKTRGKYTILLAEDNAVNQKVLMRFLTDSGYKVNCVVNGIEALNSVQSIGYDLVLMDIQMPEMDGLTASEKIRQLNGDVANIPIIAITAHALMGDKEKCMRAGMNDYLSKPVNHQKLTSVIDKWLDIDSAPIPAAEEEKVKEAEVKLVDFEHFINISLNNFEFQQDLAGTYISDTLKRMGRLEALITENDLVKAAAEAHTIKGASFSTGALLMGETAKAIELALKNQNVKEAIFLIPELNSTYELTKTAFEEKLNMRFSGA